MLNLKTVTATGNPLLLLDYREIDEKHFLIDTYICDVESLSIIALPIAFNPNSVKVCGYNVETGEFSQISDGPLSAEQVNSGKYGIAFGEKALDSKYWAGSLIYNEMYPYISNSKGYIHFTAYSLNSEFSFEGNNLFYSICFERISDASPEIRIASESNTDNFDIASPTGATLMNFNGIIDVGYEFRGEIFTDDIPINPEEPEDLFGETEYSGGTSLSGGTVSNQKDPENKEETKKTLFSDVDEDFWAYEYIYKLAENKIINGYSDNTFKPNGNITRAELTKIAVTAKKLSLLEKREQFSDSPVTAWHNPYLITAYDAGIISGYPDGSFGPEKNITREDLCVVLANTFFKDIEALDADELAFEDMEEIAGYAKASVKKIFDKGIVQGRGGNIFAPKANATRAEAAKIVCMCLEAMN